MKPTRPQMNKMKWARWLIGCGLIILIVLCAGLYVNWSRPIEQSSFLMDTQMRIVIYDKGADKQILSGAFALIKNIDQMMNAQKDDSELSRLNREKTMMVSDELFSVIQRGLYFSEQSGGLFDITVLPLTEVWDFKKEEVPDDEMIQTAKRQVDYHNVTLRTDQTVVLSGGARLDLGAIAKGYAADRVCDYLKEAGVKNALVDLGGNIKAIGNSPKSEEGFVIGLQNPDSQRGSYFASVKVHSASVVSSGIYERNFQKDGQFYHHIIDLRTGKPLQNGVIASSVIAESSMDADALSTIVMLMGEEAGLALINSIPGVECVIVKEDKSLFLSDGLKNEINITDDTYHISD